MPTSSTAATAKEQFNVRVSPELKERLDKYAALAGQSKAQIAANALSDYLDWRIPQIENLKLAIAAADRGEFADPAEVEKFFDDHED
jgi:predicted transcriptional regulator